MNEDAQLNRTPPGISWEGIALNNSPPGGAHSSLGISWEGIALNNSPPQGATATLGTSCNGIALTNSHPRGAPVPPGTSCNGIALTNSHPGGASQALEGISCEGIALTNSPPLECFPSFPGDLLRGGRPDQQPPQGSSAGVLPAGVHGIAQSPAVGDSGPARGEEGIALNPGTRGNGGVTKQQYKQQ